MLAVPTTELWIPQSQPAPNLYQPNGERIATRAAVLDVAIFTSRLIKHIGRSPSTYTRPAEAELAGGNCYTIAEAMASLLLTAEIPNYIIIGPRHATNLVSNNGYPLYADGGGSTPISTTGPIGVAHNREIYRDHTRFLYKARDNNGAIAAYFWTDDKGRMQNYYVENNLNEDGAPKRDALQLHLVMSALEGIKTLHTIGELKKAQAAKEPGYGELRKTAIPNLPTFKVGDFQDPEEIAA